MSMSIGDAVNELTRFKNVFQAAEALEQVLNVVVGLDSETKRLQVAKREAEVETAKAYELRDKAKALLETVEARLREYENGLAQMMAERKAQADKDILAVKNDARAKMQQLKADHERQVAEFYESLKEKAAKL